MRVLLLTASASDRAALRAFFTVEGHDIIDALQVMKINFLDFVQINVTRQSL